MRIDGPTYLQKVANFARLGQSLSQKVGILLSFLAKGSNRIVILHERVK